MRIQAPSDAAKKLLPIVVADPPDLVET